MTQTDATADRSSLVPGAHRLIRAVDAKEGPFAGTLVTYEDTVAVCISAERLADWPGWAFSDAEHVCGVLDLRRRTDGHDALLPWCTCRVETFLGRRLVADVPLHPGELGTLVASVVRGVRELAAQGSEAAGDWWLTADGRPLFVHGEGGAARPRTANLVARCAEHTSDRATIRILDEIAATLRQPRHHVENEQRWEDELFTIAAPRALRLDVFAPERAGEITAQRVVSFAVPADARTTRRQARIENQPDRWQRFAFAIRERADELIARLPRRERVVAVGETTERETRLSRRRSLVLAGALGATVLVIGLVWPGDQTGDEAGAALAAAEATPVPYETAASDDAGQTSAEADVVDLHDKSGEDIAATAAEVDALTALPRVLEALQKCATDGDTVCADAVTPGARVPDSGVAVEGRDASTAVLVEDYGDVAVVRLTPTASEDTEQMLVLRRQNDLWLLRDLYDVAKQPE